MKVTVDTNVLLRGVVLDDSKQAHVAAKILNEAALVSVSLPCLCEFAWVLRRVYAFDNKAVSIAIRTLLDAENVVTDRAAVEAGLAILDAGGDFADGVMAHEGKWLGGETFVSFDKKAVNLLAQQGVAARLLA